MNRKTVAMSQCVHGERVRREGVSKKNGKPYVAHFCPAPKGSPDQCPPEFEKDAPAGRAGAPQRFAQEQASADFQNNAAKKDATITKLAIVKELIARGDKFSVESVAEAEKWVKFCEGKTVPLTGRTAEEEIPVSEIPF